MDEIPKKPPRPMLKPKKPSAVDLNPTPEKIKHVTFQEVDTGKEGDFQGEDGHNIFSSSKEGRLDQPHLQSTYLLQNQMDHLLVKHKQSEQHCKQQLQMIDSNQIHVNDKVSTLLNFGKDSLKYNNLTSLDVDEGDIAVLSAKPRIFRPKYTQQDVNEEDIMEFFTSDLITESPDLELDIDTAPNEDEETELPEFSFDFLFELYRTQEKTQ